MAGMSEWRLVGGELPFWLSVETNGIAFQQSRANGPFDALAGGAGGFESGCEKITLPTIKIGITRGPNLGVALRKKCLGRAIRSCEGDGRYERKCGKQRNPAPH